ncbi:MAG: hypothetical protein ABIA77_00935 [Candidatus Omnitrophota bacterium]
MKNNHADADNMILSRFRDAVSGAVGAGKKPVWFSDLDATLAPARLAAGEDVMGAVTDILGAGVPFVILSGASKRNIDRQFLLPYLEFLPEKKKILLDGLLIGSDNGTQIYRYDAGGGRFDCVFSANIGDRARPDKYGSAAGLILELMDGHEGDGGYDLRAVLEQEIGMKFKDDEEWKDFKAGCIEERKTGGTGDVTQVTVAVIRRAGSGGIEEDDNPAYSTKVRYDLVKFFNRCFNSREIDMEARASGLSSIDITRKGVDKGSAMRAVCGLMGRERTLAIFSGNMFRPGDNDEPALKDADIVINVGMIADIERSGYFKRGTEVFQLPDSGPEGFRQFCGTFVKAIES